MVILDVSIVNVALPSIDDGLHFSTSGLQWVVNAYTLTFAGFLMLGGRCADLLGRRRVFLVSTALFSASLAGLRARRLARPADRRPRAAGVRRRDDVAGDALDHHELAARGRRAQPRPRHLGRHGRARRLLRARFSAACSPRSSAGPRSSPSTCPLGVVVIVCGLRFIPAIARPRPPRATSTSPALCSSPRASWASPTGSSRATRSAGARPRCSAPIAAGVVLLGAFVLVEGRFASAPLVPLRIFRIGQLRTANAVVVLLYAAFFPRLVLPHDLPAAGARLQRDRRRASPSCR